MSYWFRTPISLWLCCISYQVQARLESATWEEPDIGPIVCMGHGNRANDISRSKHQGQLQEQAGFLVSRSLKLSSARSGNVGGRQFRQNSSFWWFTTLARKKKTMKCNLVTIRCFPTQFAIRTGTGIWVIFLPKSDNFSANRQVWGVKLNYCSCKRGYVPMGLVLFWLLLVKANAQSMPTKFKFPYRFCFL